MGKVNLHLGCGKKNIPGFIHIDLGDYPHIDYKRDASDLSIFDDNSVDLIYACHLLEHFGRHEYENVLKEWYRVLKPKGILRIAVPDFEKIVQIYSERKDLELVLGLLVGGQDYPENTHYMVFDYESLSRVLKEIGFKNIHKYDWKKTIHKDYDDFSQAYTPHMDKKHGTLMSLNLECEK